MSRMRTYSPFGKRSRPSVALVCLLAIAGYCVTATQPALGDTELIPREVLFGNPDKAGPQLSDDATRIAYLAPVDGVLNVLVGPADNPDAAKPVTHDKKRGIRGFFWAYTNEHILYTQDQGGDENWRVYCVDLASGETKDLTPFEKVQARVQEVSHKFPDEILVGLNNRNPQLHDIHRVNIRTGEMKLVQSNPGMVGFMTDDDYNVRLAFRFTPDGGQEILKPGEKDDWHAFAQIPSDDALTTSPAGFDKTGQVLYMIDSRGRDTAAFTKIDMSTEKQTLIAADPRADVSGAMIHPTERTVEAVTFTYERREWKFLDKSVAAEMKHLQSVADGDVTVIDRTRDDQHWLVAYLMDNGPVRYYHYDRATKKTHFLFTNRSALEGLPLAHMHPVVVKSRDGLNLVNYLTLPVDSDADGDARPNNPLPMVLFVHGGPWSRDNWGYNPYHQWLANRGYAVLSVNFRASTGFGKKFVNAADGEWGRKTHYDLIDSVEWAIKEGIADPKRVAIMGGSYGGYATLWALTGGTPEFFACGVDIVGPSSLVTLLESVPPYWKPLMDVFTTRIGDHRTEEGKAFLVERSPLTYVENICRPLLIAQGANDPRVKQSESDQIVKAMQEKNIPVTYVLFPDEGHGFARPENSMSFNAVAEAFLAQHLGGCFEPVGDDFKGSSITVPAGAAQVPGLADSLPKGE